MKIRRCSLILIASLSIGLNFQGRENNALAQTQQASATIPASLSHAAEFVAFLNKNNLNVLEVGQSHFSGFLGTKRMAAYIKTDKGVVEVVFLEDDTPADKITITYQKGAGSTNHHLYTITAEASTRKTEKLNTAYPIYFTLNRNWIIITLDAGLETTIKRALGQIKQ